MKLDLCLKWVRKLGLMELGNINVIHDNHSVSMRCFKESQRAEVNKGKSKAQVTMSISVSPAGEGRETFAENVSDCWREVP